VRPILDRHFPDFEHAAALIGYGSDVLGLDDEMSRDHEWGPRVLVFGYDLSRAPEIEQRLAHELPATFAGFPTHFGATEEEGTTRMTAVDAGQIAHRVQLLDLGAYLRERIAADPRDGFTVFDWLTTPTQRLLELTAGDVFADPRGDLARVRETLEWYPHDVWLYAMAGHWQRIAEYEHFVGRTGFRGDDLGSRLVAASLARDLMRLGFLQSRRYPPYAKWLGTAYAQLGLVERPSLERALRADDWREREDALVDAAEAVARRHNELGVTTDVDPAARQFWGRPFRVLFADRFVEALREAIVDPDVAAIAHAVGAVDALSDSTPFLETPPLWREVRGLYDRP
jgi:PAS domain-containing protein